jgi:hypothetical protein
LNASPKIRFSESRTQNVYGLTPFYGSDDRNNQELLDSGQPFEKAFISPNGSADIGHLRMEVWMSMPERASETASEYKARIISYQAGDDPLVLQAKAPDTLAALVEGLSTQDFGKRPTPQKWSIREIVAHLADDELVGAYRIRLILSAPGTEIQAFDQDVWSRTGRYSTADVKESLAVYRALRHKNLKLLRSLHAEEWDMLGVHAERGVESLRDIARYFAGHDINHFLQIESMRWQLDK